MAGSGKFCTVLTHAKDDTDRATVAFVIANAAAAAEQRALVFLTVEGVRLSQKGYADDVHEEGFAPLAELMAGFVRAGGTVWVCSPCFKKRELDPESLIEGATIVGGASLVEFLSDGTPCVTF